MSKKSTQPAVVLIAFYNTKALGVRYLETALRKNGYDVQTIFYKSFNSIHPSKTTQHELALLVEQIRAADPVLVGLSIMSSMYLDTVDLVIQSITKNFPAMPIVHGGAFVSMFPQRFLRRDGLDFSIRIDGEHPLCALANALRDGSDYSTIPSLCYCRSGEPVINEISGMEQNIDVYDPPAIRCERACFIEQDKLTEGDPQLDTLSYEVVASRGCPFTCSYCCCVNLARLYPQGTKHVRTRSVQSVIEELKTAKSLLKKLVFVHFYDEIFPNLPGWVDEFVVEYKKHINLPFTIWSHPKMVDEHVLRKLKAVGLTEVIMGIQSGSPYIRKDVFHRYESNADIIEATRIIHSCGIFWASYDFMLRHPFETVETLQETYQLVKQLHGKYELQLHGLNFLPGTDIIPLAIEQGKVDSAEMERIMFAPMEEQFGAYWHQEKDPDMQMWYAMIYLLQFKSTRQKAEQWEANPAAHRAEIDALYQKAQKMARRRYYYKKARVVLKSKLHIG